MSAFRITLPYACFWVEVEFGKIKLAPPIASWMVGKTIDDVQKFVTRKGGHCAFVRKNL